jgi:hypothetical protein
MESRRGRRPGGAGEWIGARVAGCRARRFYSSGRRAWSRPIGSHGDVERPDELRTRKKNHNEETEPGAFSPGSGRMGRMGFFASTPFFLIASLLFLILLNSSRSQEGKAKRI